MFSGATFNMLKNQWEAENEDCKHNNQIAEG